MIGRLALAYARRRPLATILVVLLLSLGVAIVTLTLLVTHEIEARLTRDAEGIDLVVGAKGSPLQLVLAGVYHADVPPGNIPLSSLADLRAHPQISEVIPLALGDSVHGYRIVGTVPSLVAHYHGVPARGALWTKPMDAVLGSDVARATGLDVGATFTGSHGLADGGGEHAGQPYSVVGVLAATGTVLDRLVLTPLESVWNVHEHHSADRHDDDQAAGKPRDKLPSGAVPGSSVHDDAKAKAGTHEAPREITMALVRYATPLAAAALPREINKSTALVAASPAYETARLLTVFGVGIDVIRSFALLLCAAAVLMLFVALAQALDERRYDLAILRALGGTRLQIAGVLLIESVLLAGVGTVVGLALAHALAAALPAVFPPAAPLAAAAARFLPLEWGVVAGALVAGILAALWPAWRAYRLDVAATLADT